MVIVQVVKAFNTCREINFKSSNGIGQVWLFLAHLGTTCSRAAFRIMLCPSHSVNNSFKHLLLSKCWAILNQTWQECYGRTGGVLFKICSQNLITSQTLVAMTTKWNFLSNSFKIFFTKFTRMYLWWPFQKVFVKIWSIKKHGSGERGLLALYRHEEILKNSCSFKPLVRFWNNFTKFGSVRNMALVNWGCLHYTDINLNS